MGISGNQHGPVAQLLRSWARAPGARFLVAVSIGAAVGFVSFFQFGHHSLTHHNMYLSFVFGIGATATLAALTSGREGDSGT